MAPVGAVGDVLDVAAGCVLPLQAAMITVTASNTDNDKSFFIAAPMVVSDVKSASSARPEPTSRRSRRSLRCNTVAKL
jgi:hypothetical protein